MDEELEVKPFSPADGDFAHIDMLCTIETATTASNEQEMLRSLEKISRHNKDNPLRVAIEKSWPEVSKKTIIKLCPDSYFNLMEELFLDDGHQAIFAEILSYRDEATNQGIHSLVKKWIERALHQSDQELEDKILKRLADYKLIGKKDFEYQAKFFLNPQKSQKNFVKHYISQGDQESKYVFKGCQFMENNRDNAEYLKDVLISLPPVNRNTEYQKNLLKESITYEKDLIVDAILEAIPELVAYAYDTVKALPESTRMSITIARHLQPGVDDDAKMILLEKVVRRGDSAEISDLLFIPQGEENIEHMNQKLDELIKYLMQSSTGMNTEIVKLLVKNLLQHRYKLQEASRLPLLKGFNIDGLIGIALLKKVNPAIIMEFLMGHPRPEYLDRDQLINDIGVAAKNKHVELVIKLLQYIPSEDLKQDNELILQLIHLEEETNDRDLNLFLRAIGVCVDKVQELPPSAQSTGQSSAESKFEEQEQEQEPEPEQRSSGILSMIFWALWDRCSSWMEAWRASNDQERYMGADVVVTERNTGIYSVRQKPLNKDVRPGLFFRERGPVSGDVSKEIALERPAEFSGMRSRVLSE